MLKRKKSSASYKVNQNKVNSVYSGKGLLVENTWQSLFGTRTFRDGITEFKKKNLTVKYLAR